MPFKPGQSGNPKGRPPKHRALTEILERSMSKTVPDVDGKNHGGKQIVARAIRELVTTGKTTLLSDGETKELTVGVKGWFEIVKWLYAQVDGPPRKDVDITTGGEPFKVKGYVTISPDDWDNDAGDD